MIAAAHCGVDTLGLMADTASCHQAAKCGSETGGYRWMLRGKEGFDSAYGGNCLRTSASFEAYWNAQSGAISAARSPPAVPVTVDWLAAWWRSRPIDGATWDQLCHEVPLLGRYSRADGERLRSLAEYFLGHKRFESPADLELTAAMRLVVAAMACVPVLGLGRAWLRGWVSVIIYPDEFVVHHDVVDELGLVHKSARALIGEAWQRGPLVLSWRHCQEAASGLGAHNVVIHEVAHKLDLLNGAANGMPPLHSDIRQADWSAAFSRAYDDLRAQLNGGGYPSIDAYAAEEPGEFFAVLSEVFFMQPRLLLEEYPAVYRQLQAFFRQDPALP